MMLQTEAQTVQRTEALRRANRTRSERAQIKRDLASGELTLEGLLNDPPTAILNAPVGEVLEWMPGIGHWRAQRILATGQGSPGVGRMVHVEHLSNASKARIIARLDSFIPLRFHPRPFYGDAA